MSTLRIRNATNTGWIDAAAGGLRTRNASNTGWLNDLAKVSARNASNSGWHTFAAGGTTYLVTPSASSVNEGGTVTFSVSVSGGFAGTLYWTNSGTTSGADFSDGQNSGSISVSGGTGSFTRALASDVTSEGSETIVIQLRTGSTGGTVVATSSTVTVADTSVPSMPAFLTLARNDLDFAYAVNATSATSSAFVEVNCFVNSSTYFANGGNHIAFCIDAAGEQGSSNPHCGPIYRYGRNLWAIGRGFIIFGDGSVYAEQWNATFSPALSSVLGTFNRATYSSFNVKISAGYRAGAFANTMRIRIWSSDFSALLLDVSVPWGWDWSGVHTAAIAGIAAGSVALTPPNCTETTAAGSAPSATLPFSGFTATAY